MKIVKTIVEFTIVLSGVYLAGYLISDIVHKRLISTPIHCIKE